MWGADDAGRRPGDIALADTRRNASRRPVLDLRPRGHSASDTSAAAMSPVRLLPHMFAPSEWLEWRGL